MGGPGFESRQILVFNAGSSTLKTSLFEAPSGDETSLVLRATGAVARIGGAGSIQFSIDGVASPSEESTAANHADAAHAVLRRLAAAGAELAPNRLLVGHRVVHGGPRSTHCLIDDSVVDDIERVSELAPLHNPPALSVINAARQTFGPTTPMVAAFDTAMFAGLPDRAKLYAIPRELSDKHDIRRYGFHGLAHTHMAERAAEMMGQDLSQLKLITLQLGNGCSAAAIANGVAIDTSMGMTPLEGLIMGTRSGDLDPAIIAIIAKQEGLDAAGVVALLNEQSGLLGLSGLTSDMAELATAEAEGHAGARLARDAFVYRVKKYIGAYTAALGGADALVFGGGIGERAADLRERICSCGAPLGYSTTDRNNEVTPGEDAEIGDPDLSVRVFVVAVDEMVIIAREALRCVAHVF